MRRTSVRLALRIIGYAVRISRCFLGQQLSFWPFASSCRAVLAHGLARRRFRDFVPINYDVFDVLYSTTAGTDTPICHMCTSNPLGRRQIMKVWVLILKWAQELRLDTTMQIKKQCSAICSSYFFLKYSVTRVPIL